MIAPYATGLARWSRPEAAIRNFERLARPEPRGRTGSARRSTTRPRRLPEGSIGRGRHELHGPPPGHAPGRARQRAQRHPPWSSASTPTRWSRRPSSCSRSGCPATSSWRGRAPRRSRAPPTSATSCRRCSAASRRPHDAIPRTHLLSNGRYAVMVTAAGSGYSRWGDIAVTRWREDVTRDSWGSYLFLRDRASARSGRRVTSRAGVEADTLRGRVLRGARRVLPPRRADRDPADHRRLGRARRGDPARLADQPRVAGARDRADLVRRDRARAAGRRRRPPGLPEPVRRDGIRAGR